MHTPFPLVDLKAEFKNDPHRASKFSLTHHAPTGQFLHFDFSKNLITSSILESLLQRASRANLPKSIEQMFQGCPVNFTENRAALHTELRNLPALRPEVSKELQKMRTFSQAIREGNWCNGAVKVTDVVNIGIGGSDLGPCAVYHALKGANPQGASAVKVHFVSNVDDSQIKSTLAQCNPKSTLFVIVSKTFTTQETMINAAQAKEWLKAGGVDSISSHFIAVTSAVALAEKFGVSADCTLEMWDWVGGRFSVWSAVGFSLCVGIGWEAFEEFLRGAHSMDEHFRTAPLAQNIPVIMGLIGILYNDYLGAQTHAVIPYEQALEKFPAHLQQLDMESNGKRVSRDGSVLEHSGPVVWGEPGTNGQHAFFQLLHQGTKLIPVDLLVGVHGQFCEEGGLVSEAHKILVANCLAQGEALLNGKTLEQVLSEEPKASGPEPHSQSIALHRTFPGNRPSSTFLYQRLDPFTMGMILAAYEHKVYVQGVLWNINSFDQWGVELGKKLATGIYSEMGRGVVGEQHDPSTRALLTMVQERMKGNQ